MYRIFTKKNKSIYILLAIFLLAIFLRTVFLAKSIHIFDIRGDAKNYLLMSRQVVEDGIYGYGLGKKSNSSNAFLPPVYPLFLSLVYWIVDDPYLQITVVRILQTFIGAFTTILAYLFIRRIFKNEFAALLTAFFIAVYPTYVQSSTMILTEVIALATMLLYFYLAVVGIQEEKGYLNILAGSALGLHILVRPTMLPLFIVPFIVGFFTIFRHKRKELFNIFLQTLLGFVVIMMPWWIRNYIVLHKIIITGSGSGNPLLAGTYPDMKDLFKDTTPEIMRKADAQAAYAKTRIIKGFTSQPFVYLKWYTIGKIQYMFKNAWLYPPSSKLSIFYSISHNFLIWVGLVGMIVNSIKSKLHLFVNFYAAAFLGLYLIFIPVDRYAYQLMFFLMAAAAYFIYSIFNRLNILKEDL